MVTCPLKEFIVTVHYLVLAKHQVLEAFVLRVNPVEIYIVMIIMVIVNFRGIRIFLNV